MYGFSHAESHGHGSDTQKSGSDAVCAVYINTDRSRSPIIQFFPPCIFGQGSVDESKIFFAPSIFVLKANQNNVNPCPSSMLDLSLISVTIPGIPQVPQNEVLSIPHSFFVRVFIV